jgi:hypothetical protein
MTQRRAPLLVFLPLVLVLGPLCALGAAAAPASASTTPAAGGGLSMDQAVKMVEKRFHARVLKAEPQKDAGRNVYVLKLLNEKTGHVWTVHVDAANGAVK